MLSPKQLILEVTNRCNLSCRYCPSVSNNKKDIDRKFPIGNMSLEFFKSIVDRAAVELPDTTIIPWMNGEPFMHPEYDKMVKYLNEKKRRYYVTTNLTLWREDVLMELLKADSGCYQLIISMDGMPETRSIESARPGTDKKLLLSNLNKLFRMHGEMDSHTQIAVKICERGQDWQEIEEYVKYYLEESEIEYVCVGKPLVAQNEFSMRTYPCQYFDNNFMIVRWNGQVPICAYNDKAANDMELSYGMITDSSSLIATYNNPYITRLRDMQHSGRFLEPCASCGFAYTGSGFQGEIEFRTNPGTKYFYHADYYNQFFSKRKNWKPDAYYLEHGESIQKEFDYGD